MPSNNVFHYSKIRTRKRSAKKSIKTGKRWNPALFGIRNPLCWNPESSTRNPESTAWNPESKTAPDSLTWGDPYFNFSLLCVALTSLKYPLNGALMERGGVKRSVPLTSRLSVITTVKSYWRTIWLLYHFLPFIKPWGRGCKTCLSRNF